MDKEYFKPTLPKALYEKIEKDVVDLYIAYNLDIPLDPRQVVERLNYRLRFFSEIECKEERRTLINHSVASKREGLSCYRPDLNTYEIWVNDLTTKYDRRHNFTIIHEIAHIRLGHKSDSDFAEMCANHYAAYALIPSPLPKIIGCESAEDLIDYFNVSEKCAIIRQPQIENWFHFSGKLKSYEQKLIEYYEKKKGE